MVIYEAVDVGSAFVGMGIFVLFVVVAGIFLRSFSNRKSYDYRKYLTNLYISAKVRELAKKESLDLVTEEKNFLKYDKFNNKHRIRDLDDKIEQELMDKIEDKKQTKESKEEKA